MGATIEMYTEVLAAFGIKPRRTYQPHYVTCFSQGRYWPISAIQSCVIHQPNIPDRSEPCLTFELDLGIIIRAIWIGNALHIHD